MVVGMAGTPLPMFPLSSVLFPYAAMSLHVFEPRYRAMLHDCLDGDRRFGVVLIERGSEVGGGDQRTTLGTRAVVVRAGELPDGRWLLQVLGEAAVRVEEWLPDDPYPRATVTSWPDEPGDPVTQAQLLDLEDRVMALFERIATARGAALPAREMVLGYGEGDTGDAGQRLYALASRIPIGTADRYAVLSAPSAADRLAALSEAVDSVAEMVEFQLSD